MSAATDSTDARWEAYYAARARAMRAQAEAYRLYAEADRIAPVAMGVESGSYIRMAANYDHMAAELETGVEA